MRSILRGVVDAIQTTASLLWLLTSFVSFALFLGIPVLVLAWIFGAPILLPWFLIPLWLTSVLTLGHSFNKLG